MRCSAPRLTRSTLAVLAALVLQVAGARGDEKKAEAQPDNQGPKNSVPPTNSSSFKPTQSGLKQLEQDLFKPFETTAPKSSLDGAFVPPMPATSPSAPAVQNKKAKELFERRRDWVFETPEEIISTPSTDDMLNRRNNEKNDEDKSTMSPLERFYERLYNKDKKDKKDLAHTKGNKRDKSYDSQKSAMLSDDSDSDDDSDLPANVRDAQREMRKLFAPKERKEEASDAPNANLFSDVFGVSKATPSRGEIEAQRERMDRYKELLGFPGAPNVENDPLKQFRDMVGTSARNPGFASTMDSSRGLSRQNPFGTQSAATALAPNLNLLPDGATLHTTPSLAPALPKIEPQKSLPPPVTFSVPRRQF